jgi:hypothetical protein
LASGVRVMIQSEGANLLLNWRPPNLPQRVDDVLVDSLSFHHAQQLIYEILICPEFRPLPYHNR